MNRQFSKKDIQVAKKREQMLSITNYHAYANQTTMQYHLTPARRLKLKKQKRCWCGCGEKEILLHCWWEHKVMQPLWKTVWKFLKEHG